MARQEKNKAPRIRVNSPCVQWTDSGHPYLALPNPSGSDKPAVCLGAHKIKAVIDNLDACRKFVANTPAPKGKAKAEAESQSPEQAQAVLAAALGLTPAELAAKLAALGA